MELTTQVILAALLSGAIVGIFLGTFGGGGSVLAAPLLIYAVGVKDPHVALGTSAAAVAAIALVSLAGHWRAGRVKWPCASMFALAGILGSIAGSQVALRVDGTWLLLAFAFAMAAIGLSMFRKPKAEGDPDVHITPAIMARIVPLGLVTGMAAGFFGIGGGFLIVPGLMMATGMTLSNAMASSLVSVALFGATTSANYALAGHVDLPLVGLVLIGGAAGGLAGVQIARLLAGRVGLARKGFAAMIVAVAVYVGWNALHAIAATP
ncbi:sulfite exporter TauE/SafE family protein [Hyphomonas sp. WL0036]|uniref:sulfite exporter TauE/SafE family protein n=1 Tax=Hyphomonas sediminis TaxID=2866160 RepID=UPI001C80410D|nr:sulfite exporter TauE/SafE family protein [Hyphomonas sediminis]MBY9065543.1 sulfite exporter TauE/SafE family protein [Hyphomonas sediminis]